MILQGYAQSPSGVEYDFMKDSVDNVRTYNHDEVVINYKNGETETYFVDNEHIHTMFLLNDEGKTLKVLWRRPRENKDN